MLEIKKSRSTTMKKRSLPTLTSWILCHSAAMEYFFVSIPTYSSIIDSILELLWCCYNIHICHNFIHQLSNSHYRQQRYIYLNILRTKPKQNKITGKKIKVGDAVLVYKMLSPFFILALFPKFSKIGKNRANIIACRD